VSVEEQTPVIHSTLFLHTREVVAAVIRDKINAAISQDNITEVSNSICELLRLQMLATFSVDVCSVTVLYEQIFLLRTPLNTTIYAPVLPEGFEIWKVISEALFICRGADENLSISV